MTMTWKRIFLLLAMVFAAIGSRYILTSTAVLDYIVAVTVFIGSILCLHIWSLQPADNLPLLALCQLYWQQMVCLVIGNYWLIMFRFICQDVESTQKKTLLHILRAGQNTKYGQDLNLAEIRSVEDFRSCMTLTTYDDYKTYVDRCLEGEKNIFFEEEVDFIAATSGTTSGHSKLYPINIKRTRSPIVLPKMGAMLTEFSAIPKVKSLKFVATFGAPCRIQKTNKNVRKGSLNGIRSNYVPHSCLPLESYNIHDEKAGQHIHMLFALREPEIGAFMALSSSVLLMMFSMVEHNWEGLVKGIRRGEIDGDLNIPEDTRSSLNKYLTPSPQRADELETIFRSGCRRMVPRIWPHLAKIMCMGQGMLALTTRVLEDLYVGPSIPIINNLHISTEGLYGLMLFDRGLCWPGTSDIRDDFAILPNINFYEFISVDNIDHGQPVTVLAHEVKLGQVYELVITSNRGLYRFRTGDIIRIASFRGNTPTYQLLQRVGDILNVHMEKVNATLICDAIQTTSSSWQAGKLTNFAASENVHVDKVTGMANGNLFYVIFIETDSDEPLREEDKSTIDAELCRLSDHYRKFRVKGTISPAQVIKVHCGSFEELKNMAYNKNLLLDRMQYKHPRVVRDSEKIAFLLKNSI